MAQKETEQNQKLELMKNENEAAMSEMKGQLKEAIMECSGLRMSLQTAETNYEKE